MVMAAIMVFAQATLTCSMAGVVTVKETRRSRGLRDDRGGQ